MDETLKRGYGKFLENLAHDTISNTKIFLTKYAKRHRAGDAAFKDAILRLELFAERL
jgi:hypothetical protein